MKLNLLASLLGAALTLSPVAYAQQQTKTAKAQRNDDGVQEAIAFQRAKDRADARQARLEARHPSVSYSNADRRMDDSTDGRRVPDPGEPQPPKVKKQL